MRSTNGDVPAHVGRNVARFRRAKGLTLEQLAAGSGVSRRTLSSVERGSNVTLETLLAIADGLHLDMLSLLFDGYVGRGGEVLVLRTGDVPPVDLDTRVERMLVTTTSLTSVRLSHLTLRAAHPHHEAAGDLGVIHRVYVLDGTVRFGPLEAPVLLHMGDLGTMRGDHPHVMGSEGETASLLLLTTRQA